VEGVALPIGRYGGGLLAVLESAPSNAFPLRCWPKADLERPVQLNLSGEQINGATYSAVSASTEKMDGLSARPLSDRRMSWSVGGYIVNSSGRANP
jgi:hypothetical protein